MLERNITDDAPIAQHSGTMSENPSIKSRTSNIATSDNPFVKDPPHHKNQNAHKTKKKGSPFAQRAETSTPTITKEERKRRKEIAERLNKNLQAIRDKFKNSKKKRSEKEKAEAAAVEEAGCSVEELMELVEDDNQKEKFTLFFGRLNFSTTEDSLEEYIKAHIATLPSKRDYTLPSPLKIRIIRDPKTCESRGMAFVQFPTPKLMRHCLSLDRTKLHNRCIEVRKAFHLKGNQRNKRNRESRKEELPTADHKDKEELEEKKLDGDEEEKKGRRKKRRKDWAGLVKEVVRCVRLEL